MLNIIGGIILGAPQAKIFLKIAGEAIEVESIGSAPCPYPIRTRGVGCGDMCRRASEEV